MYSDRSTTILIMVGCPIRIPPDQRLFAPPRSFSQLITSFIASMCLGILHTLLVALPKALDHVNDLLILKYKHIHYLYQCHKMKLPPSADCRRRFTFVNRHQFPIFKKQCGGADRDRTCDLLNANQMLSQLSYSPKYKNLWQ